jgi:hypothetical protein
LVFGAQDNHRVLAVHDDVANADFLCGFHKDVKVKYKKGAFKQNS